MEISILTQISGVFFVLIGILTSSPRLKSGEEVNVFTRGQGSPELGHPSSRPPAKHSKAN